jgi:autotransporter-associated beta strand protein
MCLVSSLMFGSSWNVDSNGSWQTAGNWCGGVPNGAGSVADFLCVITNNRTVNLGAFFGPDVGTMNIDDDNSYTISNGFFTALDFNQTGTAPANLNVNASGNTTTHNISAFTRLYDDLDIDVTAGTLNYSGGISENGGTRNLDKLGAGTLTISGTNTYTGTTTVSAGTLQLGSANTISDSSGLEMNGGTFDSNNNDETMDTLTLSDDSTIALGGANTLNFTDSSGVTWSSDTLTITGWSGTCGMAGTGGRIFFSTQTSLTSTQLSRIAFLGFATGAELLATGELVPSCVPEPSTYFNIGLIMVLILAHRWKKRVDKSS